ncbi:MAG: fused MFS/spermidine synthase [Planctomycetes bacterium]|nr:fused MFS/spermidine synthase [Planctomycetota bacterium]
MIDLMPIEKNRINLVIGFILIGFSALIAQAVMARELLVVFQGNEVALGIIFGVWLIGITLGAGLTAFFIDRLKNLYPVLVIVIIAMTSVLPLMVYFIRIARGIITIQSGQPIPLIPMVYLSFFLVVPFSIFIGIIFPLLCKVYTTSFSLSTGGSGVGEGGDFAIQIGWVYIYEALGSLLGGVVFTFLLVEHFNSFTIIMISNSLLLASTIILSGVSRKILAGLAILFFLANLLGIFTYANSLHQYSVKKRWEFFRPGEELLESVDSKYENLVIGKLGEQYQLYGNGQLVSSFPDDYIHEPLAHFLLTQHPEPKRVLLIGGGIEGMLSPILKHPSIRELHYVQLDPKMTELVGKYLRQRDSPLINAKDNSRLFIHYSDGRYFVKHVLRQAQDKFDMVILNLPDPSTAMINRFYTTDFFHEAKRILAPGGVVVTSISSAVNYFSPTVLVYVGSLYDTLKSEFKNILVTPGDRACFFATDSDNVITFDIVALDKRFKERNIATERFISPAQYELYIQSSQLAFMEQVFKEKRESYVNTDLQPISYFFNLILWDTIMSGYGTEPGVFFKILQSLKFWWVLAIIGILFLLRLAYVFITPKRAAHHQRFNSLYSIFAIGLAGLSAELMLLFAFQNIYGYIYQKIGLIIALFMLGLALGGIISNRFIITKALRWKRVLAFINLALVIFALLLTPAIKLIEDAGMGEYPFILLIMLCGIITGLAYPVASRLYLESEPRIGKASGLIDSADHFGAFLGALVTGVVFIPLFGIFQTCVFIAFLNLSGTILLIVTKTQRHKKI